MSLRVYFDNTISNITDLKISRRLNAAGTVTFRAIASSFEDPTIDMRYLKFDIYYKTTLLIKQGVVISNQPVYEDNRFIRYIDFQCTDELGLLTDARARSNASFQNEKTLFALDYLLRFAPTDWRLGYVDGVTANNLITKDLRDKETIFDQIKSIAESTPLTYFRYGGYKDNHHTLDFGTLQDTNRISFSQETNLKTPIKKIPSANKLLYEIEGYGAIVKEGRNLMTFQDLDTVTDYDIYVDTTSRDLSLADALDYDPTLATDLEYPIVLTDDGVYVVRDITDPLYARGATVARRKTNIKPATDYPLPTTQDLYYFATLNGSTDVALIYNLQYVYPTYIKEAGYTLWQTLVNELHKANFQNTMYEFEVIAQEVSLEEVVEDLTEHLVDSNGDGLLDSASFDLYAVIDNAYPLQSVIEFDQPYLDLKVGQKTFVSGRVSTTLYNELTNTIDDIPLQNISGYEPISDLDFEFTNEGIFTIKVKTGLDSYIELFDSDVILKKETKPTAIESVSTPTVSTGVTLVTESYSNTNFDASLSTGENAKLFGMAIPSVPMGSTELHYGYYVQPTYATVEVVQEPTIAGAGLIVKVALDGDWNTGNTASVTAVYIFN